MATATPPAGSDSQQPVYEPTAGFRLWLLSQIWMGPGTPGLNHYVPNVNDRVIDDDTNAWSKVTAIDPTTFVSTLLPIANATPDTQYTAAEQLISPDPRNPQSTMLLWVNTKVSPNEANIDERNLVFGTESKYAQFYVGSKTDGSATIFSAMYDSSGNLLGQNVPLVALNPPDNTIKSCPAFKTTVALADGEIVTMVEYSESGIVTARQQLRVINSTFIRAMELGTKYITSISLISPWIDDTDPLLIKFPLNQLISAMNLIGVIHYSDGSTRQLPVDGTKFRIMGIEPQFVSTIIDQKFPAVLKYTMDADEVAYGVTVGQTNFITQDYTVQSVAPDGQYTVKLYAYPVWVDAVTGYRLDWFLLNLDRNIWYRVTNLVNYVKALNPTLYGVKQTIQVSIDLSEVNGTFKEYTFTQTVGITLMSRGDQQQTNWTIAFDPSQSPEYGINVKAVSTVNAAQLSTLDISQGLELLTDWLNLVFLNTKPLTSSAIEVSIPDPTHFQILTDQDAIQEFTIDQWNKSIQIPYVFTPYSTMYIRFIKRVANNDLILSIAGMEVFQPV